MKIQRQPTKVESFIQNRFKQGLLWIETHREQFWAAVGLTLLIIVFVYFAVRHQKVQNEDAWNQLGLIHGHLVQGHFDTTRKSLQEWENRFGNSSAASYSKFLKANLLDKTSDYVTASQIYGELAQTAQPMELRPLALSAQTTLEEKSGNNPQALAMAQRFIERYPDHFLTAPMYMTQARLNELTGNTSAAAAIYDRFVILYPQSPWTALARTRIQALSGLKTPASK
ncbi:MAG: tetratricopeptide repeat protein [Elusimicrobiota bacterium]|jgi:outer membrane protein assembly factor BamD (BamD/ComL family)